MTEDQADRTFPVRSSRYALLPGAAHGARAGLVHVHDSLRREDVALRWVPAAELSAEGLAKFQALFPLLGHLDHPALARAYDFGRTELAAYYTCELAPDETLAEALGEPDEHALVQVLTGFAEGLSALHADGIVHGLVVPDHLAAGTGGGRVGSVRMTDAGLHVLRPKLLETYQSYLPPEVRAGGDVSPASDVYGLGASLIASLWGVDALAKLTRGWSRSHRAVVQGVDRHLHDLLARLIAPDPRRRPADGSELLHALRDPAWALPDRQISAESFINSSFVGREHALSQLGDVLRRGWRDGTNAVEIIGGGGVGCTRLLCEAVARSDKEGWTSVWVEGRSGVSLDRAVVAAARKALGLRSEGAAQEIEPPARAGDSLSPVPAEAGTPLKARFAAGIRQAVDAAKGRLLLVADNADTLPTDLIGALQYLVTETGGRPIVLLTSGAKPCGLPDAQILEIGPLGERDLRRLLAPLLTTALNPEPAFSAIQNASAGNPLWVRLILASWLESKRLRLTHGRPFFDEKQRAGIPASMQESLASLVAALGQQEREIIEILAVWGEPISAERVTALVGGRVAPPAELVIADDAGMLRFRSDTFGPAVLSAMPEDRRRRWHEALLGILDEEGADPGSRARHLLGVGRSAEGARDLIAGAEHAVAQGAWQAAFKSYALAFEHLGEVDLAPQERAQLAIEAARVAVGVGELAWARRTLETVDLPSGEDKRALRQRFDGLLARANVLRDMRDAQAAAAIYAEARALARDHAALRPKLLLVDVEEAGNDPHRDDVAAGLDRMAGVVERLRRDGPPELLAVALNRLAALHMRLGHLREAAGYDLACARLSRRLGLAPVAARAFINLGNLYAQLVRPERALRALDRARALLSTNPHDGLAASELVNRGNVLLDLHRYEEAEAALLHARLIRLRSGQRGRLPAVLIDLGRLRRLRGRLEEAARWYREAVALSEEFLLPAVHGARANLGELLYHQGELGEAERLLRLGLAMKRPEGRGVGLINLGRLLRDRGEFGEALHVLDEAASLLRKVGSPFASLAGIEAARTFLVAGDLDAAELRLAQEATSLGSADLEVTWQYQLVRGLLKAARREAPHVTFDAAIGTARQAGDPTVIAEMLVAALDSMLALPEPDPVSIRKYLAELEEAAAQTDARPISAQLRRLRAEIGAHSPALAGGDRPAAAELAAKALAQDTSPLGASLRQVIGDLQGVAGAVVLVAGIGADGTLSVAPMPSPETTAKVPVRPYRIAAREFDRLIFRQALEETGGNVREAARLLRIPLSTFRYRATKIGILGGQRRRRSPRTS